VSQLTIDSELKRVLGITEMTTQELNAIEWQTKSPAVIIRNQVTLRCDAWRLSDEDREASITVALNCYWKDARSIAWSVSKGIAKARMLAPMGVL
jgi:hypothetical protein